jgi:hypothetical protein
MIQTTIIGGLGLAVFAFSAFTPTQQFGILIISTMTAALVGDLLILPAILAGPLGFYFAAESPHKKAIKPLDPAVAANPSSVQISLQHRHDRIETPQPALPAAPPAPKLEFPVVNQPKGPLIAPKRTVATDEGQKEIIDGPHADLHARLRNLRRDSSPNRTPS